MSTGLALAPAVNVVIGAVPAAKSGVASATNTVARMLSGALGVAVIGSLISSSYSSRLDGELGALPPEAHSAATESIGGAVAVAAQLPPRIGDAMLGVTSNAFVDAMGVGMLVTAAMALVAAVTTIALLPGRRVRSRGRRPADARLAPALGRRP
jgi:DHA2 family integral membrane protein (MFS transporter)